MKRENLWILHDIVLGVENGTLAMARVFIVAGIVSLTAMSLDYDLFSVVAAAMTITAIVSVAIGLASCKLGDWIDDLCMEVEFGDPIDALKLKDWADAQMPKWTWSSAVIAVVSIAIATFTPWALLAILVPIAWLAWIKLVKRSANVKIRELGIDEVEIERWRTTFESSRALKA